MYVLTSKENEVVRPPQRVQVLILVLEALFDYIPSFRTVQLELLTEE